jgi:pSer/pThr/pTyr-binding forkhead associated (FHA) protein
MDSLPHQPESSPQQRQSILPNFLRSRPHRRSVGAPASQRPVNTQSSPLQQPQTTLAASNSASRPPHRIRFVPHIDSRRPFTFDPISRDVKEGDTPLKICRFTDGPDLGSANAPDPNKIVFKSKVVSRAHAEIWAESGSKFFIRDTKSSAGTFLNHARLSPPNSESRPFELKDGDVLQLGADYHQGGTEDMYNCVKIKVEVNQEMQATPNTFRFAPFSYLIPPFFLKLPCSARMPSNDFELSQVRSCNGTCQMFTFSSTICLHCCILQKITSPWYSISSVRLGFFVISRDGLCSRGGGEDAGSFVLALFHQVLVNMRDVDMCRY